MATWRMVLRPFAATLFLLAAARFACAAETEAPAGGKTADRTNVVVILVDDMGFSDIGCYGSEIPTPNIDALAADGVRFTQFYNTARCSPTRASLLTGLYPHQAGMGHLDNIIHEGSKGTQGKLRDDCVTIAEALNPAGYLTCMAGKWHLGQQNGTPPWVRGFARALNSPKGGIYFRRQNDPSNLFLNGEKKKKTDPLFGERWYSTDLWTTWGLRFVDEAVDAEQPFFLYIANCAPHFPLMAPAAEIAKFRDKYRDGWAGLREARHRRQIEMGIVDAAWPLSDIPPDVPEWDELSDAEQDRFAHIMAIYAAMIARVDHNVGRLVTHLKARGEYDNTLILLLSDNGGNAEGGPWGRYEGKNPGGAKSTVFLGQSWATLANTPLRRYKHFTHEGGISTPLVVHWPAGIPAQRRGTLERQPGHLVDVMATVMDVTGAEYPKEFNGHAIQPMEGVSLVPALAGEALGRTQPIFWEHEGNRAIRDGKWKLVMKLGGDWELYDIEADRTEQHDLAREQPDRVASMTADWDAWAKRADVGPWPGPPRVDSGDVENPPFERLP
jgi:arylsulfatase A-like enzyme